MNLNAVATALRALADAIEEETPDVAEPSPQVEMMLEPAPTPEPEPGKPAFNMYAPQAAPQAEPPAPTPAPEITKEDVIAVAQKLTQAIGQNEANAFIGQVLQQAGTERVSTATTNQLAQMYGKLALRLKEAS
jgi:ABC-type uncharacterized transport system involved in gliding motility auxiliary subunit